MARKVFFIDTLLTKLESLILGGINKNMARGAISQNSIIRVFLSLKLI